MIIILKDGAEQEQINSLVQNITNRGLTVHESIGSQSHILGVIGDTSRVDTQTIINLECVSDVKRVSEPYKAVNRKFHPEDTIEIEPGKYVYDLVMTSGTDRVVLLEGKITIKAAATLRGVK